MFSTTDSKATQTLRAILSEALQSLHALVREMTTFTGHALHQIYADLGLVVRGDVVGFRAALIVPAGICATRYLALVA